MADNGFHARRGVHEQNVVAVDCRLAVHKPFFWTVRRIGVIDIRKRSRDASAAVHQEVNERLVDGEDSRAMIARSESNILAWMRYLPPDCIEMMIKMRWDETT